MSGPPTCVFRSLLYEACDRMLNPVHGAGGDPVGVRPAKKPLPLRRAAQSPTRFLPARRHAAVSRRAAVPRDVTPDARR
jgi:hypothetical protein